MTSDIGARREGHGAAPSPGPPAFASVLAGGTVPDATGHFGIYGGSFAPEALTAALDELTAQYAAAQADPEFQAELARLLRDYAGRPTLLTEVPRFGAEAGCRVLLKREDLTHTGSHKINNVLGQALLTKRMGKTRVIAETGAGQHGVATATACALFGLDCVVYMGEEDTRRQALNVARMRMLGAEVIPVTSGSRTLKDAMNEAFRDWVASVETTHYCIGSVGGPHPFPMMVRDFQRVIGVEAREQVLAMTGRLPDAVVACVGGGSNAIGIFHAFIPDTSVRLIGCEAGGEGPRTGPQCGHAHRRVGGRAARHAHLPAAGRGGPDAADAFDLGRPGLSGRGPGARLAPRNRPRLLPRRHRRAGPGRLRRAVPHRRDHPRPGNRARAGRRPADRTGTWPGRPAPGQPVRPRRQGRGHRLRTARLVSMAGPVSAVARAFERASAENRAALIGYLPAGFPSVDGAITAAVAMAAAGADIIEVGLPYSDPLMDGPVIQEAVQAALTAGTKVADTLRTVEAIAGAGVPVLVMTYWNPIDHYGVSAFARDLAAAGGSGLITPDLTPEEAGSWLEASDVYGLDRVFLVAPSSSEARIATVTARCRGFVYAASLMGITGARDAVSGLAAGLVGNVRAHTRLPVAVGLGVRDGTQAAEVAEYADGVIVGSAFVQCLLAAPDLTAGVAAVRDLATELAAGVRGVRVVAPVTVRVLAPAAEPVTSAGTRPGPRPGPSPGS